MHCTASLYQVCVVCVRTTHKTNDPLCMQKCLCRSSDPAIPNPTAILVICKKENEGVDDMEWVQRGIELNKCQCHYNVAVLHLECFIAER